MLRRLAVVPFAAAWTVAVAACGGGGEASYSMEKTKECLQRNPAVKVEGIPKTDFIASTALGGAFAVRFPRNLVTISFAENREEARHLTEFYADSAGRNIGILDVLRPVKNVVMLWVAHPADRDLTTIQECLK